MCYNTNILSSFDIREGRLNIRNASQHNKNWLLSVFSVMDAFTIDSKLKCAINLVYTRTTMCWR